MVFFFWLWLGKLRLTAIKTLARERNNAVANRRIISYNPSLLMCHIISASPFHSVRIKLHLHNWLCRRIKAESRVLGFGMEILVSGSMTLSPTWNMISYELKVSEYPWEERRGRWPSEQRCNCCFSWSGRLTPVTGTLLQYQPGRATGKVERNAQP